MVRMIFQKNKVNTLIASVFLCACCIYSSPVKAEVAVIDSVQIMQEYSEARKVLDEIKKAEETLKSKISSKRKEIKQARDANKTETEMQMLAEKFKMEIEPEAKKLEESSKLKTKKVEEDVKKAIEQVAKENKYDVVLLKQAVLYGAKDVSAQVLQKLEKGK